MSYRTYTRNWMRLTVLGTSLGVLLGACSQMPLKEPVVVPCPHPQISQELLQPADRQALMKWQTLVDRSQQKTKQTQTD